ncbi:MAG: nicotinate-nucleotide adenylyltransferase [Acidimicrobiia bacterium]
MRRGILGGTFDPPHIAHLVAAEAAYRELELDVVTFIPAGAPWQKADRHVSGPDHRWNMTRLAIEGVPYFEADDREVLRPGWSYTADTLGTFPGEEELVVVLGADAALGLPTWNRWERVTERATIAVMPRPGVDRQRVDEAVGRPLHWLDAPELAVSGAMLRERLSRGGSVRFLVADRVRSYVSEQGLYGPA